VHRCILRGKTHSAWSVRPVRRRRRARSTLSIRHALRHMPRSPSDHRFASVTREVGSAARAGGGLSTCSTLDRIGSQALIRHTVEANCCYDKSASETLTETTTVFRLIQKGQFSRRECSHLGGARAAEAVQLHRVAGGTRSAEREGHGARRARPRCARQVLRPSCSAST
jgi:hypothetical protein